jgi:hypothetical protein
LRATCESIIASTALRPIPDPGQSTSKATGGVAWQGEAEVTERTVEDRLTRLESEGRRL